MDDTLYNAIFVALPNRCCQDPKCPYDKDDARKIMDSVVAYIDRQDQALAFASVDPGTVVRRKMGEVGAEHSARAVRQVLTQREAATV